MSRVYLPSAEQFDLMNEHLANIANALAMDMDISTWAGIQKAVRVGVAPDLIPVGTQLSVNHSVYGSRLYDVVAHNHFKSAHDKNAHTMTLMCHDQIAAVQFDSPEAFYYAESELPAGTYNFTLANAYSSWAAGTYQFTLITPLPAGGQLTISGASSNTLTSLRVQSYANRSTVTPIENCAITLGNAGTSIGSFGVELNHTHRVSYGSDSYKDSAIAQFLNSSSSAGSVWTPQTKFDRPPSWTSTLAGFAGGLDDDFLSVIGEVVVPCAESMPVSVENAKYTVNHKFYLPSQIEIFNSAYEIREDDSIVFPYYENATDADRIKYRNGVASKWWLRSAYLFSANGVRVVHPDGYVFGGSAHESLGCVPVCTIV